VGGHARFGVAIAIVLSTTRPSDACIPVFTRAIVGAPAFEPAGAVAITGEDVDVSCDEHYACMVTSTFRITVTQPARASVKAYEATELTLAASTRSAPAKRPADRYDATTVALDLAPTDTRLVQQARVEMPEYIDGCFTDGVIARHKYLASAPASNQHILQIDTSATPRLHAPASWDLVVDVRAPTRHDVATTRLWFDVPAHRVTHGGALAMLGAASGDGRTFHVRGGWEAAIGRRWLVFGLTGETDFASAWNVALTVEPTSSAWILPVTFGAGAGVVVASGARVGGRGQLSIALGPVRTMVSVDVVTAGGGVDTTLVGLLGIGL
jgi:hypothetical protein